MLIETGVEERNGKDAAQGRRLEKLRRDFGPVFLAALNDPQTIEILLNADGTLWQEKLGGQMAPIGQMSATRAERANEAGLKREVFVAVQLLHHRLVHGEIDLSPIFKKRPPLGRPRKK